jgi:hypothetical protein
MTKTKTKQPERDRLVEQIISTLKKKGVRCGTGDQMEQIRKASFGDRINQLRKAR